MNERFNKVLSKRHNKMTENFITKLGLLRSRARSNHQVSLPRVLADLSGDWLSGFSSARIWESSRTWPWCRCGLLELWRRGGAGRGDRGAVPGVDMANGGHAVPMAGPCSGWGRGPSPFLQLNNVHVKYTYSQVGQVESNSDLWTGMPNPPVTT